MFFSKHSPDHPHTPSLHPALAILGGAFAAVTVWATMSLLRSAWQVRTVPERLMEWVLLFVPLELFEAGLQRFGFDAKRYALFTVVAVMLAALAAIGAVALRGQWSWRLLLALALDLWLVVMLGILPLTGAGFFASALLSGSAAAVGGYLTVALAYAAALALCQVLLPVLPRPVGGADTSEARPPVRPVSARRAALALTASAAGAFGATAAAVRLVPRPSLPRLAVPDPQQPFPSGGIAPPSAHPSLVATRGPEPPPSATRLASADPFAPPPARKLERDKEGALLAAGRRPGELAPLVTATGDFYVVTKNAAGDPEVALRDWALRVDGAVQRPVEIDYASLRNLPPVEVTKTLMCISNFVDKCEMVPFGCDLMATAVWRGARVRDLLALAGGPRPGAVSLATIAADEFSTSLPIDVALSPDTLLAYEMNGQVLPREHGYPARMLVPGRYGMKNAKWVLALRVLDHDFIDWYGQRGWSKTGLVKTMTRIDSPAPGATLPPGEHRAAGIAYAGDRGVSRVEFSADAGQTWTDATFVEPPQGKDCWVRWQATFRLAPGAEVTLMARATDGIGNLQIKPFSLPQPDGGSGWHTTVVRSLVQRAPTEVGAVLEKPSLLVHPAPRDEADQGDADERIVDPDTGEVFDAEPLRTDR